MQSVAGIGLTYEDKIMKEKLMELEIEREEQQKALDLLKQMREKER